MGGVGRLYGVCMTPKIKTIELSRAIKRKLEKNSMSQRQAAFECGVNSSTLSRIISAKGLPDFENIAKVCDWLNMPYANFLEATEDCVVFYEDQDKLEIIVALINGDENLAPEDRRKLIDIFIAAYDGFARVQNAATKV